jgi:hypothetical protein
MSLTRNTLKAMGLTPEQEDSIINAHVETVNALKAQIDELTAKANKADDLEKKLTDATTKLTETENKVKESEKEIADYHKLKDDLSAKETRTAKEKAFTDVLKGLNISDKWHARIIRGEDFGAIELNKDGTIKGADKLTERIKEEWGDTIGTQVEKGYNTPNPPANNGGKTMTKADILAITDTSERQKAMKEHAELFGITQ